VGLRGALVPVFALSVLLGAEPEREPPRWLALCASDKSGAGALALAFRALEAHARVPKSALSPAGADARGPIRELYRIEHELCAVISVPAVVAGIRAHMPQERSET
jgi:hypothetical protein